jgi:glucose-6-phosphate isomerase
MWLASGMQQVSTTIRLGGMVSASAAQRLAQRGPQCGAAVTNIAARRSSGEVGFLDLPDSIESRAAAHACLKFAAELDPAIDTVVVLGIGGSSLGPKALHSALAEPFEHLRNDRAGHRRRLLFADNIDPVTFAALLQRVDLGRTLWNVVTKSGGTAETAAQLLIVYDKLVAAFGLERAKRHIVCTTDPEKGALRATAKRYGFATLDVPSSIGGRFSVLTPVGLLPAALAGLDIVALLDGAKAMRNRVLSSELASNPALALAAVLHDQQFVEGRPMVVVMAYADGLYDIADWFRQLWAESLGKQRSVDGTIVHVGPTPIAARGATDQHSQLQLYAEGPNDKSYIMLSVAQRSTDVTIPASELANSQNEYSYLAGRSMGELLDAELQGTMASLRGRGRPVGHISLAHQDAYSVGQLVMLLEAATAYAGPLYGVDPFDQPGVEEAKRLAFAALGRPGYTSSVTIPEGDYAHFSY